MPNHHSDLGLLMAAADGTAVLPDGLPWQSTLLGTTPKGEPEADEPEFLQTDDSKSSLVQGWAVLHAPGRADLLDAVQPLVAWRRQGIADAWSSLGKPGSPPPVQIWEVPAGQTGQQFLRLVWEDLPRHKRPQYLLILGDFDDIDLPFQRRLARELFVGRICGTEPAAYRAYADKVIASEAGARRPTGRVLLYSTSDPGRRDAAVDTGLASVLQPVAERSRSPARGLLVAPQDVHLMGPKGEAGLQTWAQSLTGLRQAEPGVLLSITHGAGDAAWGPRDKRALQGQTVLPGGAHLDEADVASKPFLPGGIWFNLACFGGGTPQTSSFAPWLRRLVAAGAARARGLPDVLATQASEGAFVARQPQLALANPEGPVAVIAHADIAFTFTFKSSPDEDGRYRPDIGPIEDLLGSLLSGSRAGVAFDKLSEALTRVNSTLLQAYQGEAEAQDIVLHELVEAWRERLGEAPGEAISEVYAAVDEVVEKQGRAALTLQGLAEHMGWSAVKIATVVGSAQDQDRRKELASRAMDWMAHHDLSGWILLGDPAAQLAVGDAPPSGSRSGASAPPVMPFAASPRSRPQHEPQGLSTDLPVSAETIELAVAEYIVDGLERGERTGSEIAKAHGLTFQQLRAWHKQYTAGGRAALRPL